MISNKAKSDIDWQKLKDSLILHKILYGSRGLEIYHSYVF